MCIFNLKSVCLFNMEHICLLNMEVNIEILKKCLHNKISKHYKLNVVLIIIYDHLTVLQRKCDNKLNEYHFDLENVFYGCGCGFGNTIKKAWFGNRILIEPCYVT